MSEANVKPWVLNDIHMHVCMEWSLLWRSHVERNCNFWISRPVKPANEHTSWVWECCFECFQQWRHDTPLWGAFGSSWHLGPNKNHQYLAINLKHFCLFVCLFALFTGYSLLRAPQGSGFLRAQSFFHPLQGQLCSVFEEESVMCCVRNKQTSFLKNGM